MAKANRTKRAGERAWGGVKLDKRIGDKEEGRLMTVATVEGDMGDGIG